MASAFNQVKIRIMVGLYEESKRIECSQVCSTFPHFMDMVHVFGKELAQVTELAEEYGVSGQLTIIEEDERYLRSHNLVKFSAGDYLNDVQELFATYFPNASSAQPAAPLWI